MQSDDPTVYDADAMASLTESFAKDFGIKSDKRLTNKAGDHLAKHRFQKGHTGNPAGRPVGTKNRETVRQIADRMQYNPVEFAIMLLKDTERAKKRYRIKDDITLDQKIALNKWVGDKIYASLKSVDYTVMNPNAEEKQKLVQLYLPEKASPVKPIKDITPQQPMLAVDLDDAQDIIQPCDPIQK